MQTTILVIFIITSHSIIYLASASTLAGNTTIIGSMANFIVIETAASKGVKIKFMEFFRIGIVVTGITLVLSFAIIYLQMSFL